MLGPQVTIVVLGNKLDKQDQRSVDSNMAQNWAKTEKVRLWEVSVVDRRTLIEPFVYLASKMTQPQSKSTFPLSRNKNKGSGSVDSWGTRGDSQEDEGGMEGGRIKGEWGIFKGTRGSLKSQGVWILYRSGSKQVMRKKRGYYNERKLDDCM